MVAGLAARFALEGADGLVEIAEALRLVAQELADGAPRTWCRGVVERAASSRRALKASRVARTSLWNWALEVAMPSRTSRSSRRRRKSGEAGSSSVRLVCTALHVRSMAVDRRRRAESSWSSENSLVTAATSSASSLRSWPFFGGHLARAGA